MSPSSRKRGVKSQSPSSRPKKKHKRLDAIFDRPLLSPLPTPPPLANPSSDDDDDDDDDHGGRLRRSSRARRAPEVLDSSPVPSNRGKKKKKKKQPAPSDFLNTKDNKKNTKEKKSEKSVSVSVSFEEEVEEESDVEGEGWRSRLRSRTKEGKGKSKGKPSPCGVDDPARVPRKGKKKKKGGKRKRVSRDADEIGPQDCDLVRADGDEEAAKAPKDMEEEKVASDSKELEVQIREDKDKEKSSELKELEAEAREGNEEIVASDLKELEASKQAAEAREVGTDERADNAEEAREEEGDKCTKTAHEVEDNQEMEIEKVVAGEQVDAKTDENTNVNAAAVASEKSVKESDMASPMSDNKLSSTRVKEGRRCGLCGGGTDGRPPRKLMRESADSDNETYGGSSASEEPNYDVWDGFGDEPGWLGKLLGPIHDRFGIARVWVHQHCAVWSPEVYFAGLGCLKNVRAALCRGRALKCSRCGRPGATIGCRVDRCPKTYHLPCSRAEGCIFDHRKFLIACHDHRHLFQPQGISYSHQIRKRKARKLKLELRKHSNDAWRKDLDAEEKWLEHCGEDEEFLKREGKRLHRDILRIAPTYIGGSSENEILYQGWESVAGLQSVIQCMKEVVILPLLYPDFFSNLGLTPPRGVLLHGYPGTGKTLVVRALIGACSRGDKRIAYFARKGADCLGKYVGDAERQLRLLFQVAEKSQPSIIFFDEIDGLAPVRSRHQDQTHSSVVSTLLSLMDGLKSRGSVIVIGATNRPEAIDPALRRPGRFDREIYFPLPSEKDRSAILSLHTRSWPNPLSGTLLSRIANQTVGYAGADLQALCTQAAMNALKRNVPLNELLSYAEKGSAHGRLPSLPSIVVEERDWLEALALAPPPCSQREAGMAANDVVSSPLPMHLTPCLLLPLSLLLISFYNDERIWLPPVLSKAAKSIRSIIISSLEQRKIPTASWRSHLHHLIQEKLISKEIEAQLCRYGLINVPSVSGDSFVSDDDGDEQKFDSFMLRHPGVNIGKSMKMFPLKGETSSGFRALISGSPRSGQQYLCRCLLHGFMGHVEIQKVNLATISQEGHGDLHRGLTQIISKCLNLDRCVIYMPRIELWAVNENLGEDVKENHISPMSSRSLATSDGTKSVSEIWNAFVEQVDSASTSACLIVLATCELQNQELPLGIKQFFTRDVFHADSVTPVTSQHTIPRFFVHIDEMFDRELVINSSAAKLSDDLVRYFVQLLHHTTHPSRYRDIVKVSSALEVNTETQRPTMSNGQKTGLMTTTACSELIALGTGTSNDENQLGKNADPSSLLSGNQVAGINPSSHQDFFPRNLPSKATMGSSTLAIATFGYQILRCPQFAELCWVTSKLREGPCTDINGPWKGWPFNTCVMHGSSSPDKVSSGGNSSIHKERDNSGVVRGLAAVGLLSYRGVYASVREVATEVRKVLELLVLQIRTKILARKDRYQHFRILSQVAFLEDMVNSWAFKFESLHTTNPMTESNTKLVSKRSLSIENNLSGTSLSGVQSHPPDFPSKSCSEAQDTLLTECSTKDITANGQHTDFEKGLSHRSVHKSNISMITESEHLEEDLPSSPLPSNIHSNSSLVLTELVGEAESCRTEDPELSRMLDNVKQLNGLEMEGKNPSLDDPNISANATKSSLQDMNLCCNSLDTEHVSEEPCKTADLALSKDGDEIGVSKFSCLYKCCSGCLHALYVLARDILYQCWESNGRCSNVDDINNVVSSCSLNLLAAFRKGNRFESNDNLAEYYNRNQCEHCVCQNVCNKQLQPIPSLNKTSTNMFLAADGSYHLRSEGNSTEHTESNSPFPQDSTYFFRDGALVSSGPQKDDVLHCEHDKVCLCSVLEIILTIRKPMD